MDPDQILTEKAISEPHRLFTSPLKRDQTAIQEPRYVLKKTIIKELQNTLENGISSHLENCSQD